MKLTKKEQFGVYLNRYSSNKIDFDEFYNSLEKLFNENKIENSVDEPIENIHEEPIEHLIIKPIEHFKIKRKTLQKGHDYRPSIAYRDAKSIQANNRNNTNKAIEESIDYMYKNEGIVGFTFNRNVNRPWFHNKIVEKDHHNIYSNNEFSNRSRWHDLYIKK